MNRKNCSILKTGNSIYHCWLKNGKWHRDGSFAMECVSGSQIGSKVWCQNGKLHREDGPAVKVIEGSLLGAKAYALIIDSILNKIFRSR